MWPKSHLLEGAGEASVGGLWGEASVDYMSSAAPPGTCLLPGSKLTQALCHQLAPYTPCFQEELGPEEGKTQIHVPNLCG